MSKRSDRILVIGFVATLFIAPILFFLLPIQPFSELENRYLQKAPVLTWDNLISKQFADDAETFITDHFPFRTDWVQIKSTMEQLRLQQENNGIYKGKDDYLFEQFAEPDNAKLRQYTEALRQFAANHAEAKLSFMLAPTSIGMYPDRLPWMGSAYDQAGVNAWIGEQLQDNWTFLDGYDFLKPHAKEPIYYRTDHHWTTTGAYYAYAAYAKEMGWKPKTKDDFDIVTVSESFLGSYHTRSQFSGVTPDSIQVYLPNNPVRTEMNIADTDTTVAGLYDESYLAKKDQYPYFLGGVHALMTMTSDLPQQAVDEEKLLVIKDSYAHCMLPFLTQHVSEIHVIDIRYYNGSIGDYMNENGIANVLCLFNTATFVDNQELLKINK